MEDGEVFNVDGRHLKEVTTEKKDVDAIFLGQNPLKTDEDVCNALGNENACNVNVKCSWCKAGAVADACHSIDNAKRLPPAVFDCSKIGMEQEKKDAFKVIDEIFNEATQRFDKAQEKFQDFKQKVPKIFDLKDDEDDCNALNSENSCNAQSDKCSWCKSGAVADKCHSQANAK